MGRSSLRSSRATHERVYLQWKKYLTTMQIAQFVIDLHLVYFGSKLCILLPQRLAHLSSAYQHFVYHYYPHLPHVGDCQGAESSAVFGCGLLSSYLLLFIKFYIDTYKQKPVKGAKASVNGTVNGNGKAHGKSYVPRFSALVFLVDTFALFLQGVNARWGLVSYSTGSMTILYLETNLESYRYLL